MWNKTERRWDVAGFRFSIHSVLVWVKYFYSVCVSHNSFIFLSHPFGFFPILCFSSRACSSSWNKVFATKQTETTHLVLILGEHCHCTCTVWWVQMRMIEHSLYYSSVKRYFSTLLVDTGDLNLVTPWLSRHLQLKMTEKVQEFSPLVWFPQLAREKGKSPI